MQSILSLFVLPTMLFSSVLKLLSLIQVSIAYTYFSHLFPAIKLLSQDAVFLFCETDPFSSQKFF